MQLWLYGDVLSNLAHYRNLGEMYARDCMGEEADYDEELVSMHKESFEHWMTKGLGEMVTNGKKVLQVH